MRKSEVAREAPDFWGLHESKNCAFPLKKEANTLCIEEPSLPRKQKRNGKLVLANKTQFYCDIEEVTIYYKRVYFNAIERIVACIQDRFNQTSFQACHNIEQLLLNAVNNKNYEEQLKMC